MAENNGLYYKVDGDKELLKPRDTISGTSITVPKSNVAEVPLDFTKKEGVLSPSLFIIISGGVKREKQYFQRISDCKVFPRIKIEFRAKDSVTGEEGLSPRKMHKEAVRIKEIYDESKSTDIDDKIFLVADVDLFLNELKEIKPLCEVAKIKLVVSNSCFEIWLYYGHESEKPIDFKVPSDIAKISSEFKAYLNQKVPGGVDPRKAIFNIEQAITNAKKNYIADSNGIPVLFSTDMFKLAEELVQLIKPELEREKRRQ